MNKVGIIFIVFLISLAGFFAWQKQVNPTNTETGAKEVSNETGVGIKPRDKIITHVAEKGDTVQSIGQKFSISSDSVRWANSLTSDVLNEGQSLKIVPVTGVSHTVVEGDTIDSIAEKYRTDKQAIIDFPFNEFANAETFALIPGKILIVPDGKLSQ